MTSDDLRTVLKDLRKIVEAEKTIGLKIIPTKCEIFYLVTSLKNDDRKVQHLSKNFAPGSKHQRKMN